MNAIGVTGDAVCVEFKGCPILVDPYTARYWALDGREIPVRIVPASNQAHVSVPGKGPASAAMLVLLAVGLVVPPGYIIHHLYGLLWNTIYDLVLIPKTVHAALHSVLKRRPERVGPAALKKLATYPYVLDYVPRWKAERMRSRIRALGLPATSIFL